ncbi:MAG: transglycosylase SLT domain-containing protein [Candidatus Sumerlaeaceae bacterium]
MNPQRVKLLIGVAIAALFIGGLGTLATRNQRNAGSGGSKADDENDPNNRRSRAGHFNAASNASNTKVKADNATTGSGTNALVVDKRTTVTIIADAPTTNSLGETEAETRERERYETAQRNAFKYRKIDPEKVKPTELAPAFQQAAKQYNVPSELLAALAYVESGGTHRDGGHSMDAGFGVMNLRENNIVDTAAEAASLLGKSKEELLQDQKLNILGSAALLAKYHEDALASGVSDSEAWYMAIAAYSGFPNPELAAAHADEVGGWLIKGFEANVTDGGGSFTVSPNPNPLFLPKNWKLVGLYPPPAPGVMPLPINPNGSQTPPQ